MDSDAVSNAMLALITGQAKFMSELTQGTFQHLTQAGGATLWNLILQHGGVGDDSGLIAALQTAAGAPKQGAITQ